MGGGQIIQLCFVIRNELGVIHISFANLSLHYLQILYNVLHRVTKFIKNVPYERGAK